MPERKVSAVVSVQGDSKGGVGAVRDMQSALKDLRASYQAAQKDMADLGGKTSTVFQSLKSAVGKPLDSIKSSLSSLRSETSKKMTVDMDTSGAQRGIGSLQGSLDGLLQSLTSVQGVMGAAGAALIGLEASLGKHGAGVKQVEAEYARLMQSVGADGQKMLAGMRQMMGGTTSDVENMSAALRLANLAGEEFLGALPKLMGIARKQARAMNIDISYALDSVILGFARGSALILDNLGVMVDQQKAMDDYAAATGIATSEMTKQHKTLAILQQIEQNYGAEMAHMAELELNEAEAIATVTAQWKNAKDVLSKAFSPTVASAATVLGQLLGMLQKIPAPLLELAAKALAVGAGLTAVVGIISTIGPIIAPLIPIVLALAATAGALYSAWNANVGGVKDKVTELADTIKSKWFALANEALMWGFSLIENYAVGMVRAASAVIVTALNTIGNLIAGFLRSASPPKEGVLTGILDWGRGLMNTYLEGMSTADFGILDEATSLIQDAFKHLESIGAIDETEVAPWIAQVREEVAQLLATFRQTGEIDQGLLDLIGTQAGDMGAKLAEYLSLQLQYEKATQGVTAAEEALAAVRAKAEAKTKRIDKLESLGVSPKILSLMRDQVDAEMERAEAGVEAAKAEADAVKEKLDWQKQYIAALQSSNSLQSQQIAALEAAARAAEAAARAAAGGGGVGGGGVGGGGVGGGVALPAIEAIPLDLSFVGEGAGDGIASALTEGLKILGDNAKREWERIKGEMLGPITDIQTAWEGLKSSFADAGGMAAVADLVGGAWDTLQEKAAIVIGFFEENWKPFAAGLAASLGTVLVGALVTFTSAAAASATAFIAAWAPVVLPIAAIGVAVGLLVAAWENDWGGMRTELTEFWEGAAKPAFEAIKTWLETTIPVAITAIKTAWETGWGAIETAWNTTYTTITDALGSIKTWFTVTIPGAVDELKTTFFNKMDELNPRWREDWEKVKTALKEKLDEAIAEARQWILDLLADVRTFGTDLLKLWNDEVWGPVIGALSGIWTDLLGAVSTGVTNVQNAFTSVDWGSIGSAIIDGVKDGVSGAAHRLAEAAAGAVNNALQWAKNALGIHSPSSVWFDEVGLPIMEGTADGVDAGAPLLQGAIVRALDMLRDLAESLPAETRSALLEVVALAEAASNSLLKVAGRLGSLSSMTFAPLSGAQRGALAESIYGLLDMARGVAQALQSSMADLGGGDALSGYAEVQVIIETLSQLMESLSSLSSLQGKDFASFSGEQLWAIADTVHGLMGALRGVAAAMREEMSDLGGGGEDGALLGYAQIQIQVETLTNILDALGKLADIRPGAIRKVSGAQIWVIADTIHGLMDAMRGVAATMKQGITDLGDGDVTEGYESLTNFAETTQAGMAALESVLSVMQVKIRPSQLNRTIALYDLIKKTLAHWLRRISDLALAWRDKYGGEDSLAWLDSFVIMLQNALEPLKTIVDLSGDLANVNLEVPTVVFDDILANLERATEVLEKASLQLTGKEGYAIRKRIEATAPVFKEIGETIGAIVQPFKELAVSGWVPETAFAALEGNLLRTITWFNTMYDQLWLLAEGADAYDKEEDFERRMSGIARIAEVVGAGMEAFQAAFDTMTAMAKEFVGKALKLPSRVDIDAVFGFVTTVAQSATQWYHDMRFPNGARIAEDPLAEMQKSLTLMQAIDQVVSLALSIYDRIKAKNATGGETFGMVVEGLVSVYESFTEQLSAIREEIIHFGDNMDLQWYSLGAGLMDALIDGLQSRIPGVENTLRNIYASLGSLGGAPALPPSGGGRGRDFNFAPTINNFGREPDVRSLLTSGWELYRLGRR